MKAVAPPERKARRGGCPEEAAFLDLLRTTDMLSRPLAQVLKQLSETPAKQVLALVDTCFSGAGGRSVLPAGARPLVRGRRIAERSAEQSEQRRDDERDDDERDENLEQREAAMTIAMRLFHVNPGSRHGQ